MKGWESAASRAVTVAVPRVPEPVTGQSNMVSRPELALISVRLTMTVRVRPSGENATASPVQMQVAHSTSSGRDCPSGNFARASRPVTVAVRGGWGGGGGGVGQAVDQHGAAGVQDRQQVPAGGEREALGEGARVVDVSDAVGARRVGDVPQRD